MLKITYVDIIILAILSLAKIRMKIKNLRRYLKRLTLLMAVLSSTLAMLLGAIPCQATDCFAPVTASVSIGTLQTEPFPLCIAEEKQFFIQNGLDVNVLRFDTETEIMEALENGELDFAWSSEFAVVSQTMAEENISVIASIEKSFSDYLIGRRDLGIENIADIKGKRVGLSRQTILEFYLARFLELNNINTEDVSKVNIDPSQSVEDITSGDVDAVVVMLPYVAQIQANLGNMAVMWSVQSNQATFNLLSAKNEWIAQHPAVVNQLLKAMNETDDYLEQYPDQARQIIQQSGEYDDIYINEAWLEEQFFLSLDQSLIVAMEDEALWMIDSNLTTQKQIPNFLNDIYLDGLTAVEPQAVNIIH